MHRDIGVLTVVAVMLVSAALTGVAGGAISTNSDDGEADAALQSSATVTISNQTSGGHKMVVDSVTLPNGGFVTIHDGTLLDDETLGSVRGTSAYLEAGTHENVTVHIDQQFSEDATVIAMPHKDTDGDRVYDFLATNGETDGPYTRSGDIVLQDAEATVSATVSAMNQPTDGDFVVVEEVSMAQGGFVTIHDSSLLDDDTFGSVRGTSEYLESGVHEDVRVRLDEPLTENGTVIPMPHRDTNGNEAYDFVSSEGGEDAPYLDRDGEIVLTTAQANLRPTATASIEAQPTGGNLVYVDSVYMPDGGFVTIHDETLADGQTSGSVRGTSAYLEPGMHHHVGITLDDPLNESQQVFAMPHRDTDGDESYDFLSSDGADDGPYTQGGSPIFTPADVTVSGSAHIHHQSSDGRTIVVRNVDLSQGGFVTIHDASLNADATLESVRGTSEYLSPGLHEEVEVTLDDPMQSSQQAIAMPHRDTNANQAYDFVSSEGGNDGPYTDGDENIVLEGERAVVSSQVTIENQSASDEITVSSVTLANGGFVTIHDASLLDDEVLGSVRGSSEYLSPGTHEDVTVTLDDPVAEDGTFIAMPHRDTNGNEAYDFVSAEGGSDGPYVAAGGAVVHSASITAEGDMAGETTEAMGEETTEAMGEGTTEAMGEETTEPDTPGGESSGSSPGFGVVAALLAVLAAAVLARRD